MPNEQEIGQAKEHALDPATWLGITLKEPIVTGEGFQEWLFSDTRKRDGGKVVSGHNGHGDVIRALKEGGYADHEIEGVMWILSGQKWGPSEETLDTMVTLR